MTATLQSSCIATGIHLIVAKKIKLQGVFFFNSVISYITFSNFLNHSLCTCLKMEELHHQQESNLVRGATKCN